MKAGRKSVGFFRAVGFALRRALGLLRAKGRSCEHGRANHGNPESPQHHASKSDQSLGLGQGTGRDQNTFGVAAQVSWFRSRWMPAIADVAKVESQTCI